MSYLNWKSCSLVLEQLLGMGDRYLPFFKVSMCVATISDFTTIQIKLMLCPGPLNNLCFLLTFINILKYFNVTRLPLLTPISLTNKSKPYYPIFNLRIRWYSSEQQMTHICFAGNCFKNNLTVYVTTYEFFVVLIYSQ